jgi:hypothetical protein
LLIESNNRASISHNQRSPDQRRMFNHQGKHFLIVEFTIGKTQRLIWPAPSRQNIAWIQADPID